MTAHEVSPLWSVLRERPDLLKELSPAAIVLLSTERAWSLRDDQLVPAHDFQSCGTICGRGFGKTYGAVAELIRQVRASEARSLGLMGPTDERTKQAMVDTVLQMSPWYDRPKYTNNEIRWSNGASAQCFTAENPKGPRGSNFDLVWCSELVAWPGNTRREAWNTITTATRNRTARRILWDTTSLGNNDLILERIAENERDPQRYVIARGTIFDNPIFGVEYLRAEIEKYPAGRRRDEELFGKVFSESAGALWQAAWIETSRRLIAPTKHSVRIVSVDPATTHGSEADLTGMCVAEESEKHIFILRDHSDKCEARVWVDRALDECESGASGIVCEVTGNSGGHYLIETVRSRAERRGLIVTEWPAERGPIPPKRPGVVFWREMRARDAKETRAYAPAGLTESGRVHLVGRHDALEYEMTTWVPGDRKSPNRLDAMVYAVLELSGFADERPRTHAATNVLHTVAANRELTKRLQLAQDRRPIG